MRQWQMQFRTWIGIYFGAIAVFATLYCLLPHGQFSHPLSPVDAAYLSAVTITTTGFGDITAHGTMAKLCVSLEATAGITITGLFLASLWRDLTIRLEASQATQLRCNQRAIDRATLLVYWRYIEMTITQYRRVAATVTTPVSRRTEASPYDPAFRIADMQDVMTTPTQAGYGPLRSVLERYFDIEDQLAEDLKYLLHNAVVAGFPPARDLTLHLLSLFRSFEQRDLLLSMHDASLQEALRKALASQPTEPDAESTGLGLIGPVVVFARHVHETQQALQRLTEVVKTCLMEPAGERPDAGRVPESGDVLMSVSA